MSRARPQHAIEVEIPPPPPSEIRKVIEARALSRRSIELAGNPLDWEDPTSPHYDADFAEMMKQAVLKTKQTHDENVVTAARVAVSLSPENVRSVRQTEETIYPAGTSAEDILADVARYDLRKGEKIRLLLLNGFNTKTVQTALGLRSPAHISSERGRLRRRAETDAALAALLPDSVTHCASLAAQNRDPATRVSTGDLRKAKRL